MITHDYKIIDDKLVLKTEDDYQAEEERKIKNKILNEIKPLLDSMATQQLGIDKGIDPADSIYTDQEIKDWIKYSNDIAKGKLDSVQPEIPEVYKDLL